MSTISIIGTGGMTAAIDGLAARAGHTIEVMARDPAKGQALAGRIGTGATTGPFGAAPIGDLVIVAVPYTAVLDVVKQYGEGLSGKILVDITNPIKSDFTGFLTPEDSFGAQEVAKVAPADAHIVKAFNTQNSDVLAAGPVEGRQLDIFPAGDDARAIAAGHEVTALARSDESAAEVSALGARARRGSLEDLEGLKEAAAASDGVIHVAHRQDLLPSGGLDAVAAAEVQIILAYGEALKGTGKPLVVSASIGGPGWEGLGRPRRRIRPFPAAMPTKAPYGFAILLRPRSSVLPSRAFGLRSSGFLRSCIAQPIMPAFCRC